MKTKLTKLKSYEWSKLFLQLLVVFLGVTAGFLLNNWRTEFRESKIEEKYIERFLQDVNNNITDLKEIVASDSLWFLSATPLVLSIKDKSISSDSAKAAIQMIEGISKGDFSTGTYLDISNSGNLNLLRDFDLRVKIVEYQLAIEGVQLTDVFAFDNFHDFVVPFIYKEYNLLSEELKDKEIIHTMEFANIFAGYYSHIQQQVTSYKELLSKSYELREMLLKQM